MTGSAIRMVTALWLALALAVVPASAIAQAPPTAQGSEPLIDTRETAPIEPAVPEASAEVADEDAVIVPDYVPMKPTYGKGMPVNGQITFQDQYSKDGRFALWMHDAILLPLIVAISLVVLFLLLWVIVKYNRRNHATPSKTTHNTLVEVIWTVVPVFILIGIAIPSIQLLARQYEPPAEDAITIKATGYQWYWGYTYADNGGFEIISNMLDEAEALDRGEPPQLAVDNRMVVPAGVPIRLQTTGADVIHSFAVPSLWFKLDAVPGRLNERQLLIEEPGVYYGQCSELCGARHAYMPIVVEALPPREWIRWVRAQGGTFGEEEAAPAAAPLQDPESAQPGAPGDGPPPTRDTAPATET